MKTKKNKNEYWYCTIGPVNSDKLSWGVDSPLRQAVKDVFFQMFPKAKGTLCSSGWGVTADQRDALSFETNDDELKLAIIASMHDEGKPLPRYMRAWELLFAEEQV